MALAHDVKAKERTRDIHISVDVVFASMLLSNKTLEGLNNSGFYKPSPIQLHGIPLGKCGFDLILEAKSGTGKTAVFTVIALEQLQVDNGLQSIILAPTREIATQVSDVIKQIGSSYNGLNVEVVIGGLSVEDDIQKFQTNNVHILVGTPGRMRSLVQNKHIDVSAVRLLVLDEADKLMDKSFQADINYIYSALPKQKQVILSSATYPDVSIVQNYVNKAQHICPDSTSILLGIKQLVTIVESNVNVVRQTKNRFDELLKILKMQEFKQCLIFCNYQVRVGELCKMLKREKWPAEQLHGQLQQTDRLDALKTLQEYKCRILVSTDLAARGIDASNVDLVVNFEPPYEWQTYLHRIGRAGRFGSFGIAITIISKGAELSKFKEMIRSIGSTINMNYLWSDEIFDCDGSNSNNTTIDKSLIKPHSIKISKVEEVENTQDKEINKSLEMSKTHEAQIALFDPQPSNELNVTPQFTEITEVNLLDISECESQSGIENYESQELKTLPMKAELCKTPINIAKTPEVQATSKTSDIEEMTIIRKQAMHETPNIKIEHNQTAQGSHEVKNDDNVDKGVATFFELFDSFKDSKIKIEPFDELITSFEKYEPNKETVEDLDTVITNYNLNSVLNKTQVNILSEPNSDTDIYEVSEKDNSIDTITQNNKKAHNLENGTAKHINEEFSIIKSARRNINNNHLQDQEINNASVDTNFDKALKEAGLPTSFGSTKYSHRKLGNNNKNYNNITNMQKSNKYINSNKENKSQQISKTVRENNAKSSPEASTSFDDGYNTQSGLLSRSTRYAKSEHNKNRNSVYANNYALNSCREISLDNSEFCSNNYRKYKTWYMQLKTHIQQIEMALFIDELSKV